MPTVRIPTPLRKLTDGESDGDRRRRRLRTVLANLQAAHPGIGERMLDGSGRPAPLRQRVRPGRGRPLPAGPRHPGRRRRDRLDRPRGRRRRLTTGPTGAGMHPPRRVEGSQRCDGWWSGSPSSGPATVEEPGMEPSSVGQGWVARRVTGPARKRPSRAWPRGSDRASVARASATNPSGSTPAAARSGARSGEPTQLAMLGGVDLGVGLGRDRAAEAPRHHATGTGQQRDGALRPAGDAVLVVEQGRGVVRPGAGHLVVRAVGRCAGAGATRSPAAAAVPPRRRPPWPGPGRRGRPRTPARPRRPLDAAAVPRRPATAASARPRRIAARPSPRSRRRRRGRPAARPRRSRRPAATATPRGPPRSGTSRSPGRVPGRAAPRVPPCGHGSVERRTLASAGTDPTREEHP